MEKLYHKVKLYLEANSKTWEEEENNIVLVNYSDGNGDILETWNVSGLVKPTDEQLNALESEATTLESNNQVIATRRNLYGTTAEQLEYIVENGVDAFIAKQNQIKSENPKN
tara:strand:- start:42 stop:377 length:336 start_codon:yes stop_codon:yes gene_type:complete